MPRVPQPDKRPTSPIRAAFYDEAAKRGWQVTRKAWPDFYCLRVDPRTEETEVAFVTIAGARGRKAKALQRELMAVLRKAGLDTFEWSPTSGWQEYHSCQKGRQQMGDYRGCSTSTESKRVRTRG